GSSPAKNTLEMTGAKLPKMKKSYHSNAVPADDAMITRAIDQGLCSRCSATLAISSPLGERDSGSAEGNKPCDPKRARCSPSAERCPKLGEPRRASALRPPFDTSYSVARDGVSPYPSGTRQVCLAAHDRPCAPVDRGAQAGRRAFRTAVWEILRDLSSPWAGLDRSRIAREFILAAVPSTADRDDMVRHRLDHAGRPILARRLPCPSAIVTRFCKDGLRLFASRFVRPGGRSIDRASDWEVRELAGE